MATLVFSASGRSSWRSRARVYVRKSVLERVMVCGEELEKEHTSLHCSLEREKKWLGRL